MKNEKGAWTIKLSALGDFCSLEHKGVPVEGVTALDIRAEVGELTRARVHLSMDLIDVDVEGSLDEVHRALPDFAEDEVVAWADRHGAVFVGREMLELIARQAGLRMEPGEGLGEWIFTEVE